MYKLFRGALDYLSIWPSGYETPLLARVAHVRSPAWAFFSGGRAVLGFPLGPAAARSVPIDTLIYRRA